MSDDVSGSGLPILRMLWSDEADALCEQCRNLQGPFEGTRVYQAHGDPHMRRHCQMCRLIAACVAAGRPSFVREADWSSPQRFVVVDERNGLVVGLHPEPSISFTFRLRTVSGGMSCVCVKAGLMSTEGKTK